MTYILSRVAPEIGMHILLRCVCIGKCMHVQIKCMQIRYIALDFSVGSIFPPF